MRKAISKAIGNAQKKVVRKIANGLLKSLIEKVDDTNNIQLVDVSAMAEEDLDEVENIQEYGLASNPPLDSEALVASVAGCKSNAVLLRVGSSTFRIKNLKTGEVCIYSKFGQKVYLKEDGSIELSPASGKSIMLKAKTEISGDCVVAGKVTATSSIEAQGEVSASAGAIKLSTHAHPFTGTAQVAPATGTGTCAGNTTAGAG